MAAVCAAGALGGDAVTITLAAPGGRLAHGSGVVWDAQGRIVTNHHVAAAGASPWITYADGRRVPGQVVASSPADDIAVIAPLSGGRVRATGEPLLLGRAIPGQPVVAWGNPGGRGLTRSDGTVSALGRLVNSAGVLLPDMIETSTPLVPGNSGGPLFDCAGRLVGLNAAAVLTPYGSQAGFAIPAARVARVTARLLENAGRGVNLAGYQPAPSAPPISPTSPAASSQGPRLGVMVRPAANGLLVTEVSPGQPGARAGLQVGDILRTVERLPLIQPQDVATALRRAADQGWAELELARGGRVMALTVELRT